MDQDELCHLIKISPKGLRQLFENAVKYHVSKEHQFAVIKREQFCLLDDKNLNDDDIQKSFIKKNYRSWSFRKDKASDEKKVDDEGIFSCCCGSKKEGSDDEDDDDD